MRVPKHSSNPEAGASPPPSAASAIPKKEPAVARIGRRFVLEYQLEPDRLITGATFVIHQDRDQDVEFHLRWPTVEDKAALAVQRLRHRRGLHWSKDDAASLADLIDVLVMRSNRRRTRRAA
jgi:hypothetical protein